MISVGNSRGIFLWVTRHDPKQSLRCVTDPVNGRQPNPVGVGTPPEGVRQIEIRVQGLNKRPQAGKLRAFFVP